MWVSETTEAQTQGRETIYTIGVKARAFRKNGSLRAIPAGFSATGDANLPHGREGLLLTRMAERLTPGQNPNIHIGKGQNHIRMSALGTKNVAGAAVYDGLGNVIGRRFNGAWAGADLEWLDGGHYVRKHIHLHAGHPQVFEIRVDDRAGNLVASPRGWDLQDDSGKPILWAGRGYLFRPDDPMSLTYPVQTTVRVQGGKSIYTYTLPPALPGKNGWDGWTLDPSWTSQPDATDGIDTYIDQGVANGNYGTGVNYYLGLAGTVCRVLVKFSPPALTNIVSITFSLFVTTLYGASDQTYYLYPQLRLWVESEATWNIYSTGNNWATAGGFGAADCEQTDIGSCTIAAGAAINEFKSFALTATTIAGLGSNGWLIKASPENVAGCAGSLSDNATAAQRPMLTVVYSLPTVGLFRPWRRGL